MIERDMPNEGDHDGDDEIIHREDVPKRLQE
jgi:hypothetical protein